MTDAVIVENLAKKFVIHGESDAAFPTLRDRITGLLRQGPTLAKRDFWAVKDVSFRAGAGDVVALLGRNGSGKSTTLKMLSRIVSPTAGRISMRGRVSSLLEVGTGFHPELTGRENIFTNGAIHGMSRRDVQRKLDEIIAFSECETFIDTPVKRYSSGMYTRLAFSVAAFLDPDIMIIDEVLAVGDAAFQAKCLGRLDEAAQGGRTIIFVSHSMPAVQALCNKAVILNKGLVDFEGDIAGGIQRYLATAAVTSFEEIAARVDDLPAGEGAKITGIRITQDGRLSESFTNKASLDVEITINVEKPLQGLRIYADCADPIGGPLFRTHHDEYAGLAPAMTEPGDYRIELSLPMTALGGATFQFGFGLALYGQGQIGAQRVEAELMIEDRSGIDARRPATKPWGRIKTQAVWSPLQGSRR